MIESYPKDYRDNLEWRARMLARARDDSSYKEQVRELFYRDPVFAFNAFFYTLDVRRRPKQHQPFCTYPFQDWTVWDLYYAIQFGQDRVIEKSRDMGASWMGVGIYTWFWLRPMESVDFLFGSRIEDYVDKKGDPRTLIEKCRYLIYRLPQWLRPVGFSKQKHDHFMRLVNPETGSTITGESNNPNFSTGGRFTSIFYDEFAKWEASDVAAWTAGGDATPCRIAASTPFGAGGKFYSLVTDSAIKKITLNWYYHPRKADGAYCNYPKTAEEEKRGLIKIRSPWFDAESKRRTKLEISQELEIGYIGSGRLVFDEVQVRVGEIGRLCRPVQLAMELGPGRRLQPARGTRDSAGVLVIWRDVEPDGQYIIGVDVAEGKENSDNSVVKVFNRKTKDVDASLSGLIDEVTLADWIIAIQERYSGCWVGIETNGPGLATFDICSFHITKLFMMPNWDSVKQQATYAKGWRTTTSSKKMLIAGVREWLRDEQGWADGKCIKELNTFVYGKTGKAAAREGCNDDEVIALGICIQVDEIAPIEILKRKVHNLTAEGIPEKMFAPKKIPVLTLEELCFQQTTEKRSGVYWEKIMDNQLSMGGVQ